MIRNSFIVRVYDQPVTKDLKNEVELMTGVVEDADTGMEYTFHNKDELWKFMSEHQDETKEKFKTKS